MVAVMELTLITLGNDPKLLSSHITRGTIHNGPEPTIRIRFRFRVRVRVRVRFRFRVQEPRVVCL